MFTAPLLIGLASSLHCVGMCSPLVVAVSKAGKRAVLRNFLYNGGRIMTYALLGSIVSLMGTGLNWAGFQQGVSIVAGMIIITIGLANISVSAPRFITQIIVRLTTFTKARFQLNPFFMGMVNGLLPCGMTLVALGYCITLEWPADGFLAMIYFGIGTLPAMLGLSLITRSLIQKLPFSYRRIQTTLLIISGILLVGRGIYFQNAQSEGDHGIVVCGVNSQE